MLAGRSRSDAARRVLVHLCKGSGRPQRARFDQSIVSHCCPPDGDSGVVHCGLKPLQFLISDQQFPGSSRLLLKRPPFCPIKHLTVAQMASLPTETQHRGVDVGVAVLLESPGQKVLLTRRARTLSTFPNVWVPPGGHIEPGEQLMDAGLRELKEETGLQLQDGEFSWHPLALWESVYPPRLSRGLPQRHHIVIYLHVVLHESHEQLQARIKPNEAEVTAFAWLDPPTLASIAATEDGAEGESMGANGDVPSTVSSITELKKGSAETVGIPTTTFLAAAPAQGEDVERVSTGTKYALRQWLKPLAA